MRDPIAGVPSNLELALQVFPDVAHSERRIPGHNGAEILVSIVEPADGVKSGAGVYFIHGGGMVVGDRFLGAEQFAGWAVAFSTIVVSVEYRLAPEHPYPVPTEDCYAGLVWFSQHAAGITVRHARKQ
jgi:acetyl esterase/lipase